MAIKTITRKTTYLGVPAEVKEIRQAGPTGEREVRVKWLATATGQAIEYPAGTITSRTITGTERKGTFRTLVAEHIVDAF